MDPLDGDTVFGTRWVNGEIIRINAKELAALKHGKILDVEGEFVVYLQLDEEAED